MIDQRSASAAGEGRPLHKTQSFVRTVILASLLAALPGTISAQAAEYVDVETAKQAGRSNFGEMIDFLHKHPEARIILVEKTDRLYRDLKDRVRSTQSTTIPS